MAKAAADSSRNERALLKSAADGTRDQHNGPPGATPRPSSHAAAQRVANDILTAMGTTHPMPGISLAASALPQQVLASTSHQPTGSIVRLSDITPEPIRWLSPGRLALWKVTGLDGDPRHAMTLILRKYSERWIGVKGLRPGGYHRNMGKLDPNLRW